MSFFAEIFITLMILAGVCLLLAISCRLIELIWMSIYACFAPFMCPNRHREPWPVELCNILIMLIISKLKPDNMLMSNISITYYLVYY